ncbi:outer dynein arm-docking complex subunit 4 isoform X3 [Ictidomys tridecemlineatus]|uniref:Outer dynein arm-docking complex subunit 4 n=2 Tax=Ictidomys tridecemlineatus TaxID=43179 RepID=I3M793_ICTTR|nr:outer dynein arm-docking complex subunit 4 isoform X1 [Ictidomys tridecemlineatus]XP_021579904.1 outer dynein arm-docking complex subunit 4 isoform X1 [Ictidomys tridecemlineatus]XP_040124716.1 outer dynein arm-docking complex subunit 4 isoform X1 [Ictidomys tridecemlineatus]KAG3268948.1 tetratricopeptide repeat domain 25, transcript variant X1 [Ictidomys tridecemlineatus]KAG3268949.1 tetratricopeptide repeat domain 25, transcript variant X2 [Ictidomys tridecemlineatus]
MGDFEFALVFYHRGYKLRPDREFKVGIQKAQEAINNSVGSPSSIKLENKGDVFFLSKQAESMKAQQKPHPIKQLPHHTQRESKRKGSFKSEKTIRQLLGELYVDKEYLEKLLLDEDLIKGTIKGGLTVEDLIMTGINYLDTRSNFWRQQKPIYARERDRKLMQEKWLRDRKRHPSQTARYILKSLEDIDLLLTSGSAEGSLQKAEKVLKKVLEWNKEEVPNKDELLGNLYSCIGNAQIELGQMGAALQSHRKDLEIAKEYDLPDAKSRALDNIGRVFARVGKFQQAIDTWEEKIPLAKTTLEKTWLFHEIGRCYLELDQGWQAQNYGEKSQQCAEEEGDIEWQLNASVLVAQAQVKLRDFESAVNNFEKALERAKLVHNNEAQQAIISALDDANKGIVEELKKTNYREMLKDKEEAPALNEDRTVEAKEKEGKKEREDTKKVMKSWEREQGESDGDTGDTEEEEEFKDDSQRQKAEKARRSFREDSRRVSEGRTLLEVDRRESREIYRRPSELDQEISGGELSTKASERLEKRLSEVSSGEKEPGETEEKEEVKAEETKIAQEMEKE